MDKRLLTRVESCVAELIVNRPEKRNAFDTPLMEAMCAATSEMQARRGVKVLLVTGAGSAFSSGRDLAESATHTKEQAERFMTLGARWSDSLRALPFPTIAAVNGPAFGWGMVLMLACDVRLAASGAVLGYPETGLGVFPGGDATVRLVRQISTPFAKDLVLTGRRFDAREGRRLGLLNRVVPEEDLMAQARALADEIARHPLEQLRAMKAQFLQAEAAPCFGSSLAGKSER